MQFGPDFKQLTRPLMKSLHWFFPRVGASRRDNRFGDDLPVMPLYREITFRFVSLAFTSLMLPFGFWHLFTERAVLGLLILLFSLPMCWHCWLQIQYDRPLLSPAALLSMAIVLLGLSFYISGPSTLYWVPVLIVAFHFVLASRAGALFNGVFLILLVPAAWQALSGANLLMFLVSQLVLSVMAGVFNRVVYRQEKKLQLVAVRDPLTHAYNRRTMMERLEHTIQLNHRYNTLSSLILLDIDHFKLVNDQLGHNIGDSALKEVVRLLQQRLRRTDILFRYGGEEFVVLLNATEAAVALQLAEQCCRLIREARILPRRTLTVSCGVAEIVPGESAMAWLERSDRALYRAKHGGRNQARLAPSVDIDI